MLEKFQLALLPRPPIVFGKDLKIGQFSDTMNHLHASNLEQSQHPFPVVSLRHRWPFLVQVTVKGVRKSTSDR
jgi:hypothetical protein